MPDPGLLPYLLCLIDDESLEVRGAVMDQFAAFGDSLEDHLRGVTLRGDPRQLRLIRNLIAAFRRSEDEQAAEDAALVEKLAAAGIS